MSVVDRFVCRREGHEPTVKITRVTSTVVGTTYFTTCKRCGKWFEVKP